MRNIRGIAVILLALSFFLSSCSPGDGPLGSRERVLPGEFTMESDPEGGTGRVLFTGQPLSEDVLWTLVTTLDKLTGYFSERPRVVTAFQDDVTKGVQGTFVSSINNKDVSGVAFAYPVDNNIAVSIIYDYAESLPSSYERLAEISRPGNDRSIISPEDLQWKDIRFPDSSGSIRVPEYWNLQDAYQGSVSANSPDGASIGFGMWAPINTPDSDLANLEILQDFPQAGFWFEPYAPPQEAIFTIIKHTRKNAGLPPNDTYKLIEFTPAYHPGNGEAAYVYYTFEEEGVLHSNLAFVATTPPDFFGTWTFYLEQITAPDHHFQRYYPVLMEIWSSYSISSKLIQERQESINKNLSEIGEISYAAYMERERSRDRAHTNWISYIRDETVVYDTVTGNYESVSGHTNDLVNDLNNEAGYERYETVCPGDYYN